MKIFLAIIIALIVYVFYWNHDNNKKFPLNKYTGIWLIEKPTGKRQIFNNSGFIYITKNSFSIFTANGMTREGILSDAVEIDKLSIKLIGQSPVNSTQSTSSSVIMKLNGKNTIIEKISDGIIHFKPENEIKGIVLYKSEQLSNSDHLQEEISKEISRNK